MMYPIVLKENAPFTRRQLVEYLEQANIESRPMLPLVNQPIYRDIFGDIEKDYPVAQWINASGFYLGCHHGLERDDLDYIAQFMDDFLSKNK